MERQWSTLKDNFKEFAGKVMEPFTNLLKDTLLPALNDIVTGGENIKKWIEEHKTLITVLTTIIAALTVAIIANTIAKNWDIIVTWLYVTATDAAAFATGALSAAMAFLTSPITLVILAIAAVIAIVVLLVQNWETVKKKAIEIWNKIKDTLSEVITGIIEWFKKLPENIAIFIGEMIGHVIKFGMDVWNWVTNDLPKIITGIIDWFKELPGKVWNFLVNTVDNIGKWINDMKNKIVEGIPKVIEQITSFFQELPQNMLNIGKNIVEGIWNGITGAANWLANKIKEFASNILKGIKNVLGIHSPSKVFRDEVGKFLALGIGEGFSKNIDDVYKKMKTSVDFETQKLNSNLTASTIMNVERTDNISARLESIDNDREITVNAVTNLDGRVLTQSVNKVNARQRLQYGLA